MLTDCVLQFKDNDIRLRADQQINTVAAGASPAQNNGRGQIIDQITSEKTLIECSAN